jgi:uncharacterized protein YcgI (DUF1989 family)
LSKKLISDILVPAGFARAFTVKRGQLVRIAQVEGHQVGDVIIFNANDYKEHFDVGESFVFNIFKGTGTLRYITKFYSQPSRENLMLSVIEDTTKDHFVWCGARCTPKMYSQQEGGGTHRSCQANLAEAIEPFGLSGDDVPDVFNVFMSVDVENDRFVIRPTRAGKDDYIEALAEMDLLVAISSCPSEKPSNDGRVKPLRAQIFSRD